MGPESAPCALLIFFLPQVGTIAARHHKTPAQVLLRWGLQHGMAVLPRSSQQSHIADNILLEDFCLSPEDMALLDGLSAGRRFCWKGVDPATVPVGSEADKPQGPAAPPDSDPGIQSESQGKRKPGTRKRSGNEASAAKAKRTKTDPSK